MMDFCSACHPDLFLGQFPLPPPIPFDFLPVSRNFTASLWDELPVTWSELELGRPEPSWIPSFKYDLLTSGFLTSPTDDDAFFLTPYLAFIISAIIVFLLGVTLAGVIIGYYHRKGKLKGLLKKNGSPNDSATSSTQIEGAVNEGWTYNSMVRLPSKLNSNHHDLILGQATPKSMYGSQVELKKSGVELKLSDDTIITGPPLVLFPVYDPLTNTKALKQMPLASIDRYNNRQSLYSLGAGNRAFDSSTAVYEEIPNDLPPCQSHVTSRRPPVPPNESCSSVIYSNSSGGGSYECGPFYGKLGDGFKGPPRDPQITGTPCSCPQCHLQISSSEESIGYPNKTQGTQTLGGVKGSQSMVPASYHSQPSPESAGDCVLCAEGAQASPGMKLVDGRESGYGTSRRSTPFESPMHVQGNEQVLRQPKRKYKQSQAGVSNLIPRNVTFGGSPTSVQENGLRKDFTIKHSEYV